MARKRQDGRLAKSIVGAVGDIDVAVAGFDARPRILGAMEARDIGEVEQAVHEQLFALQTQIAEVDRDLANEQEKWGDKAEQVKHKVEQARLWRSIGLQERIPNLSMAPWLRVLVLLVLASLDFYIFAQAYAVVEDLVVQDVRWWLGGVLGLVVFVVGLGLAHQLKTVIVAKAQREMLVEAEQGRRKIDPAVLAELVTTRPAVLIVRASVSLFCALLAAGVFIRFSGSTSSDDYPSILFQALVPIAAVVTELYLHDPMERRMPPVSRRTRELRKKRAKLERQVQAVEEKHGLIVARIQKTYAVEQEILRTEQLDIGLRP